MSKIRKGSIVYNTRHQRFMKALTSSNHGELTDVLTLRTGKTHHPSFKGYVLVASEENVERNTYKNAPCFIMRADVLIPRKEYLEIQKELEIKYN